MQKSVFFSKISFRLNLIVKYIFLVVVITWVRYWAKKLALTLLFLFLFLQRPTGDFWRIFLSHHVLIFVRKIRAEIPQVWKLFETNQSSRKVIQALVSARNLFHCWHEKKLNCWRRNMLEKCLSYAFKGQKL